MSTAGEPGIALGLEPTELVVGALQLRIWEPSWADAALAALDDPEIACWNPLATAAPDDRDAWAAGWIDRSRAWHDTCVWAVCDAVTSQVLGNVTLHHLEVDQRSGEVGYWVLPHARGRGVATQAVAAATRFAFDRLDLHRVELFHAVDNAASCVVATRCGFLPEGTARQAYRYGDGRFHDDHVHARLATDPDPGAARGTTTG